MLIKGKLVDIILTDPTYKVKVYEISGYNKELKHSEIPFFLGRYECVGIYRYPL